LGNYTPPIIAGTTGTQMSIFEPAKPAILPSWPGRNAQPEHLHGADYRRTGGGSARKREALGDNNVYEPGDRSNFDSSFPACLRVEAQNVASQPIFVRFTIANQPTGGSASFLQFSQLTTLDVTIPQYSSVSRSVFVTSSNPQASVTVNVAQISAIGGSVVTNGLSASQF